MGSNRPVLEREQKKNKWKKTRKYAKAHIRQVSLNNPLKESAIETTNNCPNWQAHNSTSGEK